MRVRIRLAGFAVLLPALLALPPAAAWAQSPGDTETADLVGRFTAHLRGTQSEHIASVWNVTYNPAGECRPRMMSHSTDQQMTFESEPLEVDVVRVPAGTPGWDGQDYVLVPRGMPANSVTYRPPAGEPFLSPTLFELPVEVAVSKAYSDPATGEGPAQPLPFEVPCTGGDGPGGSPPPMDCGERTFSSAMAIIQPQVNVALATSSDSVDWMAVEGLYENCPGSVDPVPGGFAWGGEVPPVYAGGSLPTLDQLLDPNLSAVEVIGQVTSEMEDSGFLRRQALDWTLTLCREGSTAPGC